MGAYTVTALTLNDPGYVAVLAGFDPLAPPNFSWIDAVYAADPALGLADGAAITSVRNVSGRGDPAQATAANKPTFRSAGVNGQPSMQFDGTDYLDVDVADIAQPWKALTVYQWVNPVLPTTTQRVFGTGITAAGNGFGRTSAGVLTVNYGNALGWSAPDLNPHSLRETINGVHSFVWLDGVLVGNDVNAGAGTIARFVLGAGMSGSLVATNFFNGHIVFRGVCLATVADADIAAVDTFIRAKYGF